MIHQSPNVSCTPKHCKNYSHNYTFLIAWSTPPILSASQWLLESSGGTRNLNTCGASFDWRKKDYGKNLMGKSFSLPLSIGLHQIWFSAILEADCVTKEGHLKDDGPRVAGKQWQVWWGILVRLLLILASLFPFTFFNWRKVDAQCYIRAYIVLWQLCTLPNANHDT